MRDRPRIDVAAESRTGVVRGGNKRGGTVRGDVAAWRYGPTGRCAGMWLRGAVRGDMDLRDGDVAAWSGTVRGMGTAYRCGCGEQRRENGAGRCAHRCGCGEQHGYRPDTEISYTHTEFLTKIVHRR